jgi:isocitrate dehydrogenase (NAD+)
LFEPGCRHVAADIAGKNVANPCKPILLRPRSQCSNHSADSLVNAFLLALAAMILSSSMLLRHLGLNKQANSIASAVYKVIKDGKFKTRDIKGTTSTTDFTKAIIEQL